MQDFIVSARKYRPSTFNSVVGQEAITSTLKNAIKNHHLAQAFLFCGPRGVGKTTCARILAKTINCFNIGENIEACNTCESCTSFNQSHSFNIHELDAASNNSVDDIRNLVDQVRFAPQVGKYSIYIIDEVHMLSQAAFNAFLKTLEEPPAHAIFILATTEKHKIIPTILSRCQIFDFNRIKIEDIVGHLDYVAKSENVDAEQDGLHVIAQKADGALRDALSMFDQIVSFAGNKITYDDVIRNLNVLDYNFYFRITDYMLANNIPGALLTFDEILQKGFDGHNFINGLGSHFRNLLVCKDPSTLQLLEVGQNIKDQYRSQAQACSTEMLLKSIDIANRSDVQYRASKNQRLQVEIALMQMCSLGVSDWAEKKSSVVIKKSQNAPKVEANEASNNIAEHKQAPAPTPAPTPSTPTVEPAKEQAPEPSYPHPEPTPVAKVEEPTPLANREEEIKKYQEREAKVKSTLQQVNPALAGYKKQTISIHIGQETAAEKEENTEVGKPQEITDFTFEELMAVWKEYAEDMKAQNKTSLFVTLTRNEPQLKENYVIDLALDNSAQEEVLVEEKTNLMEYLRAKLKNTEITLNSFVQRDGQEYKTNTPRDRYIKLAEKNPNLDKLRQQLDLDIDY